MAFSCQNSAHLYLEEVKEPWQVGCSSEERRVFYRPKNLTTFSQFTIQLITSSQFTVQSIDNILSVYCTIN